MLKRFKLSDFHLMIKLDTITEFKLLFENTVLMNKEKYDYLLEQAESIEDEDAKERFYEFYFDDFHLYGNTLPRISKYGILMNLWAHLEYSVLELANEVVISLESDAKVTGRGFEDYLNFIRENVDSTLVNFEKQREVEVLRVIRNRIMHSNGFVNRKSKAKQHVEAVEYVETNDLLSFSEKDQIIVSDKYVEKCLDLAYEIIEELHNAIYKSGE